MYSNGDGDTATAADAWRRRWRSVCLYPWGGTNDFERLIIMFLPRPIYVVPKL